MATFTAIFTHPALIHIQSTFKQFISNPNYNTNPIRIQCSSSSFPQSTTAHETLAPSPVKHSVNDTTTQKWQAFRKRKVLMRVGYVGVDYRAIEKELETAIYKAGGIRDSNFGDLQKITWATSSEFDDEVHSLSTMISFKMEIPENAWIDDPNGIALADIVNTYLPKNIRVFSILPSQKAHGPHQYPANQWDQIKGNVTTCVGPVAFKGLKVKNQWKLDSNLRPLLEGLPLEDIVNTYLPKNIRVFSILPSQKSFNAKEECNMQKYGYLLPLEVIGITSNCREAEIEHHLLEFNNILNFFEGKHPFHNYTIPSKYRNQYPEEQSPGNGIDESANEEHLRLRFNDSDRKSVDESELNRSSLSDPLIFAKWLHKPDENYRITDVHFRKIFQCSCGKMKTLYGTSYVEISICGESFMFHQIRKMVGAAVAVKRGLLPRDVIPLSLNKFTRISLPIAPSEVLFLRWNHFILEKESGRAIRPEILTAVESEEILTDVEDFYESIMLPQFSEFLDPMKHPWREWVELLDANTRIPDFQLDEIRNAWVTWEENFWLKADAALYYSI